MAVRACPWERTWQIVVCKEAMYQGTYCINEGGSKGQKQDRGEDTNTALRKSHLRNLELSGTQKGLAI